MPCIGIDLGTTHSLVAIFEQGRQRLIPNAHGSVLTPSVVSVDEQGDVLVGQSAQERLVTSPKQTVHAFKRMIGTGKTWQLGKHRFDAIELSSLVLKSLKADAEAELGEQVSEAVISVPAYFNDQQRLATKQAAELAGLRVQRLINEPTAASLVYGLHESDSDKHILVLDLGGGTFDVTILEYFDGVFEVHASAGDNHLGGEDFTETMVRLISDKLSDQGAKLSDKAKLYAYAERAKKELSVSNQLRLEIPVKGKKQELVLSRNEFDDACNELLQRIRGPIVRAIQDADLTPDEFDEVVLVGGATRMPLFRDFVTRMFKRFPQVKLNPDEVVAQGTAIQSAMLADNQQLKEVVLTDVMPYSLGINVHNEAEPENSFFQPIIERNQIIPLSRVDSFYPVHERQNVIEVGIYQGESRYCKNNLKLDSLSVNIPKEGPGRGVDVRFTYDHNGILEVLVKRHHGDDEKRLVIEHRQGQMSPAEIEQALQKLAELKIHPRDLDVNRAIVERGERLYEMALGEERDKVAEVISYFEQALASQDPKAISKARQEVTDWYQAYEGERPF